MSPRRRRTSPGGLPPGTLEVLRRALHEDRWTHDVTTHAILRGHPRAQAQVIAQGNGVLSGVAAARALARLAGLQSRTRLADGSPIRRGTVVLELSGEAQRILAVERTLLNLLMHLSGVATMTALAVRAAHRSRPGFRIRATRKTLPGLRDLEKAAVVHGGGESHRRDLSDAVLIKSTHLSLVPLGVAVHRARGRLRSPRLVQVEVQSLAEARTAIAAGARRLLIDNQTPAAVTRIVRALRRVPGGTSVEVEVSGGISAETVAAYARTGADAASLGRLTHSAPAVPFHLTLDVPQRASPR
ncbi:MAG: carboxylating nicotinate-nucleotide diphosphorylase [Thermoplasmata archaeon]|nr:carboxylating nicotinate-nucleotide diphosphorylase [Thermoplasmata archaeon]